MVRRELLIRGEVQGVSFRKSTRRVAEELQVTGWVRNLSGGEVQACIEGPRPAVAQLTEWCIQGPPRARVDEILIREADCRNEFQEFAILADSVSA